jgi:ribonuclease-3
MNGNAFEALIGAIYLDRGYDYCMWFMQNKILNVYLNIDKVAYKEVNFKSKLLEWSQKNRVNVSFELVSQSTDSANSPKFTSRILIEGLESGEGEGYSKKESQQIAAKVALTRLKQEPQFIDAVFAEKSKRTAMEEEPTELVPDTGTDADDFAADEPKDTKPASKQKAKQTNSVDDEMSLDNIHVSTKEMSREDIIAAAEAAAFADNK